MMPELSPRLQLVAKYILDHPSDFGLDPIRKTAHKSGVSTYTLVRLAAHLGFASYDSLREPFRMALVDTASPAPQPGWLESLSEKGEIGKTQAEAAQNSLAIVSRSLEHQNPGQIARIVEMLLEARTVYITAVRASYGLAYYLHYMGRMALPSMQLIPRHMSSAIDELHNASKEDVLIAITFDPYSRETVEACAFARERGAKLILLSDSEVISSAFQADEVMLVTVLSPHHFACYSGATAVIEALVSHLAKQIGPDAIARIKSYETLRNKTNAYSTAPKKH
jgi:DNA-binding MurR/RpiR family transcriptional regulator